jgi:hypothetical protein
LPAPAPTGAAPAAVVPPAPVVPRHAAALPSAPLVQPAAASVPAVVSAPQARDSGRHNPKVLLLMHQPSGVIPAAEHHLSSICIAKLRHDDDICFVTAPLKYVRLCCNACCTPAPMAEMHQQQKDHRVVALAGTSGDTSGIPTEARSPASLLKAS